VAQTLSPATRERLNQALGDWQSWHAGLRRAPSVVEQLPGKSNENFLVSDDKHLLVVRLNRDASALGVDRDVEYQLLADIADEPFAPDVIFAHPDYLVTRRLNGGHPSIDLARVGSLFRDIHETKTTISATLDPLVHAANYLETIEPSNLLAECLGILRDQLGETARGLTLCHNDLLRENMIDTDRGLIAIDWEYGRLGDPAFDLAVFVRTYDLDDELTRQLLTAYGDVSLRERVDAYRELYALIDILWWQIRDPSAPDIDDRMRALAERLAL
jgi:aminoglycoside phosphotransferase (APT) family kinase protein